MLRNRGFAHLYLLVIAAILIIGAVYISKKLPVNKVNTKAGSTIQKELSVIPKEDSYVWDKQPTKNYGGATVLKVSGSPGEKISYLKFFVDGANFGETSEIFLAQLTLNIAKGSKDSQNVKILTSDNWTESSINYNNRPDISSANLITSINTNSKTDPVKIDLTNVVKSNLSKTFTVVLDSSGSSELQIYSKESGTGQPTLQITYNQFSTPLPEPTNPPPPTTTPSPIPNETFTPAPTRTPIVGSLPLCPSHDATSWHSLIDTGRNCRYDHAHNENPTNGNSVFGPPAAAWGGQTISYPWNTSLMENTHKHGGYKYAVLLNQPCDPNHDYETNPNVNCIRDARVEYHFVGGMMDGLSRYHSYYAEYRICKNPNFTECGIFRTGGWADLGVLAKNDYGGRVVRPGGTINYGQGSPYGGSNANLLMSFSADTPDLDEIASPTQGRPCCDEPYWFSSFLGGSPHSTASLNNVGQFNHFGHNRYLRFLVRIQDSWDMMDPNDPNKVNFFCRDGSCENNGSLHEMGETSAFIPTAWDPDGDGFADKSGFTDRYGNPKDGCTASSLDCVPFSVIHVPVGYADTRDDGCECNRLIEYDVSPPNEHWIQFPN